MIHVLPRTLFPVVLLLATTAIGQSLYVIDELVITVRSGPGIEGGFAGNLTSGDRVDVLETNTDSGYSRVRADDGTQGWVLTRFLSNQIVARDRLATSEASLAQAQDGLTGLEAQLASVSEELESTRQRLEEAETANTTMNSELLSIRDASTNALTLRDQNESLRRGLNDRDQRLEQITRETEGLRSAAGREWFVVGAGVLLVGIVVGLIVPSLRRKRRSEW